METTMHDDLELPAFLRIPQAERRASWKGRKLTTQGAMFRPVTKTEEAATRKLRKELEAAEAAKKAERFARLKELAAEKKAAGHHGQPKRKRPRK
jgi:hypothetical protein